MMSHLLSVPLPHLLPKQAILIEHKDGLMRWRRTGGRSVIFRMVGVPFKTVVLVFTYSFTRQKDPILAL